MVKVQKITIFVFLVFLFCLFSANNFVLAQRPLEVPLPGGGETTPLLPDYVKYIFNFTISIGGLIAFIVLIYGGVRYLTSAGNPSKMADANSQIFSALLGLVMLLGSWLILTTINPQLVIISLQTEESGLVAEEAPGVYLCEDTSETNCRFYNRSTVTMGDFNDKTKYVMFRNPDDYQFGAVLHQDDYYGGKCRVCLNDGCDFSYAEGISSITVFSQSVSSEGPGVTFYELDHYDEKGWYSEPVSSAFPYKNWQDLGLPKSYGRSIKIENEGKYLIALFENENMGKRCEVFTRSDPGLASNPIGICDDFLGFWSKGCFSSAIILPIGAAF